MAIMASHKLRRRHGSAGTRNWPWPLLLIAAPAAVAVWSGWVGLGSKSGFGPVNLLPGIGGGFHLNTAITLPVGIESYGAYALYVWIGGRGSETTRTFARRSAIGALVLGCLGQVVYHLLAAANWAEAPPPVVVFVACLPVVTLSFAAALVHLTRADIRAAEDARAEAERERAEAEARAAERAAARQAAKAEPPARKRTGTAHRNRTRKPAGTTAPEPVIIALEPAAESVAPATAEPAFEAEPEPAAEETVDVDAEARILKAMSTGELDTEAAILQLVDAGHKPSRAGKLAGRSDSYGRQVVRKARELAGAAPKGQDPEN